MKVSFSFEVAIEVMTELVSQHQVSLFSDVYCLIVVLTIIYHLNCILVANRDFNP
jgi:hypothetical protein